MIFNVICDLGNHYLSKFFDRCSSYTSGYIIHVSFRRVLSDFESSLVMSWGSCLSDEVSLHGCHKQSAPFLTLSLHNEFPIILSTTELEQTQMRAPVDCLWLCYLASLMLPWELLLSWNFEVRGQLCGLWGWCNPSHLVLVSSTPVIRNVKQQQRLGHTRIM